MQLMPQAQGAEENSQAYELRCSQPASTAADVVVQQTAFNTGLAEPFPSYAR